MKLGLIGFLQLPSEHGWVQSDQDKKIKRQIGYQWDNSLSILKKTNIEGELISEIGNEFKILGPR